MKYKIKKMDLKEIFKLSKEMDLNIPKDETEVTFDFSKVHKFDPLPMLLVGSIIRRYISNHPNTHFDITWSDNVGKSYAGTMGFYKYISENIEIGKKPGQAKGSNSYIPITPINFSNLKKEYENKRMFSLGYIIDEESKKLSKIISREDSEFHKMLSYLIREIMRNTPEHADTDKLWICGQYWKTYNIAEIAILDEGIGVFQSIKKNVSHRKYILNNREALEWSLRAGISDAFSPSYKPKNDDIWSNSGFGLFMVSEICKSLNGSFCLISYDNYILVDSNDLKVGDTSFEGTAIRISVPCYKVENAKEIINNISSKGEEQSKLIKNSFKKASIPSKGLIDKIDLDISK